MIQMIQMNDTNGINGDTFLCLVSKFVESRDKFVLSCLGPCLCHVTSLSFACFFLVVLSSCHKIKLKTLSPRLYRYRNASSRMQLKISLRKTF